MKSLFPFIDKVEHLRDADPRMAQIIERFGYLEHHRMDAPLFDTLVRNVVGQQIATSAADRILGRLLPKGDEITPEAVLLLGEEGLRGVGIPARKAKWLLAAAERFVAGEFSKEVLGPLSDKEVVRRLVTLDGVGVWSAEMMLIFSLSRENVLPSGDLIIRRALMTLYGEKSLSARRFDHYRRLFSPFGSVASLYLWAYGNSLPKRTTEITIRPLGFARLKDKTLNYSFQPTARGEMLIASSVKGVCRVAFADDREEALDELRAEMRGAVLREQWEPSHKEMVRLLEGRGPKSMTLYLEGTAFERKVWRELLKVPYGIRVSYADIAARTGFTKAYRSVGNAVGANPIAVIIPCHRVIHADGTLGNYNAGADKKYFLLDAEHLSR
jgi:DNA-3-methyladenine glycosylase II